MVRATRNIHDFDRFQVKRRQGNALIGRVSGTLSIPVVSRGQHKSVIRKDQHMSLATSDLCDSSLSDISGDLSLVEVVRDYSPGEYEVVGVGVESIGHFSAVGVTRCGRAECGFGR